MLSSCAWCSTPFPPNESLATVATGRRVAFDGAKGRLWVVCGRCERWNLVPIEERWEAIEECERAWRSTRLRSSTGEIGLARLPEGFELVRIGAPLRPEFAAWRYGDQFGRRRRRAWVMGIGAGAGLGALGAGAFAAGATLVALLPVVQLVTILSSVATSGALASRKPVADPGGGSVIPFGYPRLVAASLADGGWGLEVPYSARLGEDGRMQGSWLSRSKSNMAVGSIRLVGAPAQAVLARYAPMLNRAGAPASRIGEAVSLIAEAGGPAALPRYLAEHRTRFSAQQTLGDSGELPHLPVPVKLALEMSSHEEVERAFLAGELAALEAQWRVADEEAAISDALLVPAEVTAKLEALRKFRSPSP